MNTNSKIGLLITRLCLLEEVVADDGLKIAVLRTTDGNVAFFVVPEDDVEQVLFHTLTMREEIETGTPEDIAGRISGELFAELAAWDENKAREESHA